MTKSKRKSRSKPKKKPELEKEQTEQSVTLVEPVLTISPPVTDVEIQEAIDKVADLPHEESTEKPDNNGDDTKKQHEEFEARFDSITLQYVQLAAVCRDLPEPLLMPTAKEYGERFYPAYETAFRRIRKLLD